jgi:MFS family permease
MCIAVAIGPLVGGALTSIPGQTWRWCFWINLPISSVAGMTVLICYASCRPGKLSNLLSVDWFGIGLVMAATVSLMLGLQFGGSSFPWNSPVTIGLLAFSVFTVFVFVLYEGRYAVAPLLPMQLVRNRDVAALLVIALVHGACFVSCVSWAPIYFQVVLGATALRAGIWQLSSAIPLALITIVTGIWIKKIGEHRPVIQLSSVLVTVGFGLFIMLPSYRDCARIIGFQVVIALAVGPLFQAPLIAMQSAVSPRYIAVAIALLDLTLTLGSAIGLVVGQSCFTNVLSASYNSTNLKRAVVDFSSLDSTNKEIITKAFSVMWTMYTCISGKKLWKNTSQVFTPALTSG